MKIGVFVGSFDPVHLGHINIANYLTEENYVDKIIIIATGSYWNKQNITDLDKRLEMLDLIKDKNIIIDKKHNHYKYTYEILETLKKERPNDELFLVIGADNAKSFTKWKNYEKILNEYKVIIINRDNIEINLKPSIIINKNFTDISSTKIRNNPLESHELLPEDVYNYIKIRGLYQRNEKNGKIK